ncbi:entericidin A/B family lipoprotein [Hyphomonas sp.]|uniref:entericidin A/B family lipoprotein n=1 Tax=Hyphomonas sp. TaxID=87 RepID=UPI0025BA60CC|nr:entericidin A/B family lipoprotein [Hyphomonas sp.]MBI1401089.1 entericidin A/B family lipoprotein [Hyphomonas sp.]
MSRLKLLAAAALAMSALSACNTVAGAGEDLQVAGEAIGHTADEVSDFLFEPGSGSKGAPTEKKCDSGAPELKGKSGHPTCK